MDFHNSSLNVNSSTNDSTVEVKERHQHNERAVPFPEMSSYLAATIFAVICVCGLVGNAITIIILRRRLRERTVYVSMFVMAVCDFVCVLNAFVYVTPLLVSRGDVDLVVLSGCNVMALLNFVPSQLSVWMLVSITLERVMCLRSNTVGNDISNRTILLITGGLLLVLLCLNFQFFGGMRPDDDALLGGKSYFDGACGGRTDAIRAYSSAVYGIVEISVYFIVPSIIILVGNGLIIFKIWKHKRKVVPAVPQSSVSKKSQQKTETNARSTAEAKTPSQAINQSTSTAGRSRIQPAMDEECMEKWRKIANNLSAERQSEIPGAPADDNRSVAIPRSNPVTVHSFLDKSAMHLTRTCLLLSFTFIVLILPSYLVFILFSVDDADTSDNPGMGRLVKIIGYMVSLVNHCINCLVYCLSGQGFRKQVRALLVPKRGCCVR